MVTKPDLAENGGARFSAGSLLEKCEERWKQNDPARQVLEWQTNQHLVVDRRTGRSHVKSG